MKTFKIIFAWMIAFPMGLIFLAIAKTYLYIKHEAKEFKEIVINSIE